MQSKESKKDSEKSQKKVKSNPETSLESNKSIRKVQSQPETPIFLNKSTAEKIKEAQPLRFLATVKSSGSQESNKILRDSKTLRQISKNSKKKWHKSTDNPENIEVGDLQLR